MNAVESGQPANSGDGRFKQRRARHYARWRAVQALYQWDLGGEQLAEIARQFRSVPEAEDDDIEQLRQICAQADVAYFEALLHGVPGHLGELDAQLELHMQRSLQSLDPVERVILRIGCYELLHRIDIPYRVVINEAVELAKAFGAEQGHKFVNGVIDKAARQIRASEVAAMQRERAAAREPRGRRGC